MSDELRAAIHTGVVRSAVPGYIEDRDKITDAVYAAVLPHFTAERERADKAEAECKRLDNCYQAMQDAAAQRGHELFKASMELAGERAKREGDPSILTLQVEIAKLKADLEAAEKTVNRREETNAHYHNQLSAARQEIAVPKASFDLRWKADMRAIKRWQESHPGNELTWPDHADMVVWLLEQLDSARQEIERLKQRLLTAAGDDLCRLTQEEIKAMTSGAVPIPPLSEFIASCERFHAQVASEAGVNNSCLTLAQLVAENEELHQELADLNREYMAAGMESVSKGVDLGMELATERREHAETKRRLEKYTSVSALMSANLATEKAVQRAVEAEEGIKRLNSVINTLEKDRLEALQCAERAEADVATWRKRINDIQSMSTFFIDGTLTVPPILEELERLRAATKNDSRLEHARRLASERDALQARNRLLEDVKVAAEKYLAARISLAATGAEFNAVTELKKALAALRESEVKTNG